MASCSADECHQAPMMVGHNRKLALSISINGVRMNGFTTMAGTLPPPAHQDDCRCWVLRNDLEIPFGYVRMDDHR